MPCYHPITGWQTPAGGKLTFGDNPPRGAYPITVPCNGCIGCRLEKARQRTMRCMHEASLHQNNSYITLTYADEHLPENKSLDKTAIPKFIKKLRRHIDRKNDREQRTEAEKTKVRTFYCGEYGDRDQRPHYHALLFGWDWTDKVKWGKSKSGYPQMRSAALEKLWGKGHCTVGPVTWETAAYVARYVMKKLTGAQKSPYMGFNHDTGEVTDARTAEFAAGSLRPGLGKPWLDRYHDEVYPADEILVNGQLVKPPQYYDRKWAELHPAAFETLIRAARDHARRPDDETPERLRARELVAHARVNLMRKRA